MSFLNPVNEPVLRFKSTDAGAPQINYNSRIAGDIKSVLKACLVTGYAATASAGWSILNEVDHVAEFVSPSIAMSDYRLCVNDSGATNTTWYYQYKNVRTDPTYNAPIKSLTNINSTHANNGWQLLVTDCGLIFIELVQHTAVNEISARITYFGKVKSALNDFDYKNVMFFNIGHDSTVSTFNFFYGESPRVHLNLDTHTSTHLSAATSNLLLGGAYIQDVAVVDLVSPIYLTDEDRTCLIAELPPILSKIVNNSSESYGISDFLLDGRSVLSVRAGRSDGLLSRANTQSFTVLVRTDHWGY